MPRLETVYPASDVLVAVTTGALLVVAALALPWVLASCDPSSPLRPDASRGNKGADADPLATDRGRCEEWVGARSRARLMLPGAPCLGCHDRAMRAELGAPFEAIGDRPLEVLRLLIVEAQVLERLRGRAKCRGQS